MSLHVSQILLIILEETVNQIFIHVERQNQHEIDISSDLDHIYIEIILHSGHIQVLQNHDHVSLRVKILIHGIELIVFLMNIPVVMRLQLEFEWFWVKVQQVVEQ